MRPRSLGRQLGIQDRIRAASKRNTVAAGLAEPQFAPQTVRSGKEYTRWRKARLNKEIDH